MKTKIKARWMIRAMLAAAVGLPCASALAQPRTPAGEGRIGLAATLADQDRVISELISRDLEMLRDYMFKKGGIAPDQQAAHLAVQSLKRLQQPNVPQKTRRELLQQVAQGIEKVLAAVSSPDQLMRLNKDLVELGTAQQLTVMEYWGENPTHQAELRPVAEAVDKVYLRVVELLSQNLAQIEKKIDQGGNHQQLAKQWTTVQDQIGLANFSRGINKYAIALSLDPADPRRRQEVEEGMKILKDFEDPDMGVLMVVHEKRGKLQLAARTPQSLAEAKQHFEKLQNDKDARWMEKFQAVYFSAVADVLGQDPAAAKAGLAQVRAWLAANPPEKAAQQGVEQVMPMLEYRVLQLEAEVSSDPKVRARANEAAVQVLTDLQKARPELAGFITQQLVARLPANPDMAQLDSLLLMAILRRGEAELMKEEGQPVDQKLLSQGASAAREIIKNAAAKKISPDDVKRSLLLLAFFELRLGRDVQAAIHFVDFVEKHRGDENAALAFDNAYATVVKLMKMKASDPEARTAQLRFLNLATAPPYSRVELNLIYGQRLLERNNNVMEGELNDVKRQQAIDSAQKAANLLKEVAQPEQRLYALYYQMLAFDQVMLLSGEAAKQSEAATKIQALADDINKVIAAEMPQASGDRLQELRLYKVKTNLLVANLATHDKSPKRNERLEHALLLLKNFEDDAKGLAGEQRLIGEVQFIRVTALLSLGKAEEALADLSKVLEGRSSDEAIRLVYDMITALDKEFQTARTTGNTDRARELAAHRAQVSSYLVDRVSKSDNPDVKKLLPQYKQFMAGAMQDAASLESDPAKKKAFLAQALTIFMENKKANPADRGIDLDIAGVYYDMGDYAKARPILHELAAERLLGTAMVVKQNAEGGVESVPNNLYYSAWLRLLRSNYELYKKGADGFGKEQLEETKTKLKEIYIRGGPRPGGEKWADEFDKLRQEILEDWLPDAEESQQPQPAASAPPGT